MIHTIIILFIAAALVEKQQLLFKEKHSRLTLETIDLIDMAITQLNFSPEDWPELSTEYFWFR